MTVSVLAQATSRKGATVPDVKVRKRCGSLEPRLVATMEL